MSKVRSELPSVVIVQLLTHICLFETPCTAACQAFLSFTISWNFLKFMSFELVMLSNHLILHFPLLLFLSVFPSNRVFSNESALRIKCFSFSISPSVEYSGWPGLVSLQTKGLSRVFSSTTILKHQFFCLAFFTIHLSHPYMCVSHSVMSNSLQFHGLYPTRFLCPCNSPGKNTGVGCHSLLQGIFLTPWIQIKPGSPELQADSLSSEPPGKNMTAGTLTYIDFCWQSDIFIFQYTV